MVLGTPFERPRKVTRLKVRQAASRRRRGSVPAQHIILTGLALARDM